MRVHLPLRIRWPGDAAPDSGPASEALDAALERGLGDALERVRGEIFAPRGGFARPRPLAPTFAWQDEEGLVDGPARALLEARVAAAIRSAVAEHPLVEESDAPEVLPDTPYEEVDWQRMRGLEYRVHSYDGDPEEADLQVESDPPPITKVSSQDVWWRWDGTNTALGAKLRDYIRTVHWEKQPSSLGAIFYGTSKGWTGYWAAHIEISWFEGEPISSVSLFQTLSKFYSIKETADEVRNESPHGIFTHEFVRPYSNPSEYRNIIREPILKSRGLPLSPPAGETKSRSRLRQRIEAHLSASADEYGSLPNHVMTHLRTPSGHGYYLPVPAKVMRGQNEWTLHGLWETVEVVRPESPDGAVGSNLPGESDRTDPGEVGGGKSGSPLSAADGGTGTPRAELYPNVAVEGGTLTLDLSPLLDEPHVDDLFGATEAVKRLIRRIAYRLEMPEGRYCGAFLIAAAQMIRVRAHNVGKVAVALPASTEQVEPGTGNLGDLDMVPEHTPAIELMRFIAGTCPLIRRLTRLMAQVYSQPHIHRRYFGRYQGNPSGWLLEFHTLHREEMEVGVGHVYMRACQVTMLQLLRSSAREIGSRLDNFDRYFPVFEGIIRNFVATEAELQELRTTLQKVIAVFDPSLQSTVSVVASDWRQARRMLSASISEQMLNLSELADGPDMPKGQVFRGQDGSWAIRDSRGRAWTMADLESGIAIRNQTARSIDPLIGQLTDIPEVVEVFRNHPTMARTYLFTLLTEMRDNNAEITDEVTSDYVYAFRSGKIREDLPNRTVPGTRFALQGVHLLAHQAIGDAFEGDDWYATGLHWAFAVELDRLGIISFFEISAVLVVSVICPLAGAALGVILAGVHAADVGEQFDISGAVMNPEGLYDRAELELDLFMAELEIVLAVLPEIGMIGRATARGVNVVGRYGIRAGARRLGVEARRALLVSMARQVKAGLPRAFLAALATDQAMGMILPKVLAPVIEALEAELRMMTAPEPKAKAPTSGQSPDTTASHDSETQPTSPEGIAFYSRLDEYQPSPDEEVLRPLGDQP